MLRTLAFTVLLAAAAGCGSSRPESDPARGARGEMPAPPTVDAQVDSLTARLSLSETQQVSVRNALEQRADVLRSARGLGTRRERRGAMERAQVEADSRIAAALTRAQRETYDDIRAEREETKDPQIERQLAQLREPLALTDEQEAAITGILTEQADEIELLIDTYLRKGGQDVREVRDEIVAIRSRYDERIEAELTAEQASDFRRLREDGRQPQRRQRRR